MAAALLPAFEAAAAGPGPGTPTTIVARALPGSLDAVIGEATALGARVDSVMTSLDLAVVTLPAGRVAALGSMPGVAELTPDGSVQLLDVNGWSGGDGGSDRSDWPLSGVPANQSGSPLLTAQATGVSDLWRAGLTGNGVDVALIDSGVSPVPGFWTRQKLVYGPDLSFESQSSRLRYVDTFGHGTHMAGIIAGHDSGVDVTSGQLRSSDFTGVAPGARIVSVKVADATGATDVTQVLAGIDWVVQHANSDGLHIRVLNLSFGTTSTQPYVIDPLAHAAEAAWRHGIAVVVAAGNDGATRVGLDDPALDPFVIAVGAVDTSGPGAYAQHNPAAFTARGDGTRNPDLLAPGTHVVSLRDPGSLIDQRHSAGRLGSRYFLGSGTSQASAYVAGTAALLLQGRPDLTPDQLKGVLTGTAAPMPGADVTVAGHGVLSVGGAMSAPAGDPQTFTASTGGGSVDGSRGNLRLSHDGVTLTGERDIFGHGLDTGALAAAEEQGSSWSGGTWNGSSWSGSSWSGTSWSGSSWSGSSWSWGQWVGSSWSATTWLGTSWSGTSWSDSSWQGSSWSGSSWSGTSWSGTSWSGCAWQGSSWSALAWS